MSSVCSGGVFLHFDRAEIGTKAIKRRRGGGGGATFRPISRASKNTKIGFLVQKTSRKSLPRRLKRAHNIDTKAFLFVRSHFELIKLAHPPGSDLRN